jgi:hypothetical protein
MKHRIHLLLASLLMGGSIVAAETEIIHINPSFDSGRIRTNSTVDGTGFSQWNAGAGNAGNVGWIASGIWYSFSRFATAGNAAELFAKLQSADSVRVRTGVYWRSIAGGFPDGPGVDVAVYLVPGMDIPSGQLPNFDNTFPFDYPDAVRVDVIPTTSPAIRDGYNDAQANPFDPELDSLDLEIDLTSAVQSAIASGALDAGTPWGIAYFPEPMTDQLEVDNNPMWVDQRQTVMVSGHDALIVEVEDPAAAWNGHYPRDTVIDVTAAPYNADPSGVEDSTAAIQQAMDDHDGDMLTRSILYFPDGTYRLSGSLLLNTHAEPNGGSGLGIVFQGQSRDGVILRLDDAVAGFGDPGNPKAVVDFNEANEIGGWQFVAFRTYIFDLTIDIGSGNPGAIGLEFCANNTGGLRDVRVLSSDPEFAGHIGIYLSTIPGPQLLKRVEVVGFDWGIVTAANPHYTTTAEHLTLRHCRQGGIDNRQHSFTIRNLVTDQINGPAIRNSHRDGFVTLVGGFADNGPAGEAAILNNGYCFVRDFAVTGYGHALSNRGTPLAGLIVDEWHHGEADSLFVVGQPVSLRLPVKETPEPAWDAPANWVSVREFGAQPGDGVDDSSAVQAALDSMRPGGAHAGRYTLYFPTGTYEFLHGVVVPAEVRHVIGCFSLIKPDGDAVSVDPVMTIEGAGELLVMEQIGVTPGWPMRATPFIRNAGDRDLVLRDVMTFWGQSYVNTGNGELFLENVSGTSSRYWSGQPQPLPSAIPQFDFGGQNVWARQLNTEQKDLNCLNDGGDLWILGMKDEEDGTLIKTVNGGRTELLGGVCMPLDVDTDHPGYIIENARMSIVIAGHTGRDRDLYAVLVRETRNGETRDLLTRDTANKRSYFNSAFQYIPVLALYSTASASDEAVWFGYPVDPDGWVDTGDWMGWINVRSDPVIRILSLNNWAYRGDDSGWVWIPR